MMIVYNADRLEELEHAELEVHDGVRMNDVNLRHRSPWMAKFRDKQSGVHFLLVSITWLVAMQSCARSKPRRCGYGLLTKSYRSSASAITTSTFLNLFFFMLSP